ncbi:hypothetical protein UCRPC4_g05696 [Phaeomoniella chlamydospora]|uniref:Uncharacterized protein n=1 Tax=Phaeomoniella chlamydospora TaxID=158046 RepID=A0A0G2FZP3_PHACM|nr:hypothetical protein UCRPC4_g05696 [Phaeomoniella chlamydospora]
MSNQDYALANSSIINSYFKDYGLSLTNGSLEKQLSHINSSEPYFYYNSLYPSANAIGDYPWIDLMPGNISRIAFKANDPNYFAVLPLVQAIFSGKMQKVPVSCVYPVSGQYDVLPRLLYYILLLTSLIFRRHNWLATAALGSAMSYSATAAVHVLALVTNFGYGHSSRLYLFNPETAKPYGDLDVFGCYPVLAAAAIMVTPILNWSITIRNSRAQPVVIMWAVLILAALIPAWLLFDPPTKSGLCFALAFIFLQGVVGVFESQFSQAEVRNLIFRFLYLAPKDYIVLFLKGERKRRWLEKLRLGDSAEDTDKSSLSWRSRKQLARTLAAGSFGLSLLFAIACPAVFITSAVANELALGFFPVSEHSDAVGAWSAWVATAFVVLAGGLIRYREAWEDALSAALWAVWHWMAYDKHERPPSIGSKQALMQEVIHEPEPTLSDKKHDFVAEITSPVRHLWYNIGRAIYRSRVEARMFKQWWRSPEDESKRNAQDLSNETFERMKGYPRCPCRFCDRHASEDKNPYQYTPTWGQRLVSGLEKAYSQHKTGWRSSVATRRHNKSRTSDITEMSSVTNFTLPEIERSTPISFDEEASHQRFRESRQGDRSPSDHNQQEYNPFDNIPVQPQPTAYGDGGNGRYHRETSISSSTLGVAVAEFAGISLYDTAEAGPVVGRNICSGKWERGLREAAWRIEEPRDATRGAFQSLRYKGSLKSAGQVRH